MVIIWETTCFESYFWNIHSLSTHQKLEIRVSLKPAKLGSGRPIKCQEWKGGENWSKLCSLGGRVFNTGSINIGR